MSLGRSLLLKDYNESSLDQLKSYVELATSLKKAENLTDLRFRILGIYLKLPPKLVYNESNLKHYFNEGYDR